MGTKTWLLVIAAVIAVVGWLQLRPAPAPAATREGGAIATAADIDALQAQASAACRCARAGPSGACWAAFDRNLARYRHQEWVSACGADSSVSICFDGPGGDQNGQRCIARPGPGGACDDAEARARAAAAPPGAGCAG